MSRYQRKNLATGENVGSPGPLPGDLAGFLTDADLERLAELNPAPEYEGQGFFRVADPMPEPQPRRVAKVDFWRRFTPGEQVALLGARKSLEAMTPAEFQDPMSAGWWVLAVALQTLDMIPSVIELDHSDTVAGLEAFAASGIIAADRVAVVLQ
jgi:hypothetical protein